MRFRAAAPVRCLRRIFKKSLNKQTGDVSIPAAKAQLKLGKDFYFIGPDEARRVLVDIWGNPPSSADGVLGLVMPAGTTVFQNVWGAVVSFDESGYVTDDDAKTADYGQILADMQAAEPDQNTARKEAGYPAIHLVGWAQQPTYDPTNHAMVWARNIAFDGQPVNTLNYDVRLLGRSGVLSLNMLADMDHLADVRSAASGFAKTASFVPGASYADYNSKTDKAAGYGLAGLVAAGVGAAAAKKLGLLAIILGFGKKFIVLIVVALGGVGQWLRQLWTRRAETKDLEV